MDRLRPQDRPQDRARTRRRWLGAAPSVLGHLAILTVILLARGPKPEPAVEAPSMSAVLIESPRPSPEPKPSTPAPRPTATPPPRRAMVRRPAARAPADAPPAGQDRKPQAGAELTQAEIAGASSAEAGEGGGACDIAVRLQGALRKDPLVQAAVAGASGRAIRVWNGDWVKSQGEEGKGLAAVREAIMWEIAFAPETCRAKPVRGVILLSMSAAPGGVQLAVGSGEWRWSDLLRPRLQSLEPGRRHSYPVETRPAPPPRRSGSARGRRGCCWRPGVAPCRRRWPPAGSKPRPACS